MRICYSGIVSDSLTVTKLPELANYQIETSCGAHFLQDVCRSTLHWQQGLSSAGI